MLITSIKGNLLSAGIQKCLRVQTSNAVLPIIEKIMLQSIKGGAKLTCTNLDTHLITGVTGKTETPDTTILIPPSAFEALIQMNDEELIEVHLTGDEIYFKQANGNFIRCTNEDAASFPPVPEMKEPTEIIHDYSGQELSAMLALSAKFTSNDEMRTNLKAICISSEGIFSTDAHRLLKHTLAHKTDKPNAPVFSIMVTREFAASLPSIDAAAKPKLRFDGYHVSVNDKATKIISKLVNAKPPAYAGVIPTTAHIQIEVEKADLVRKLKLARSLVSTSDARIKITFTNTGYTLNGADSDLMQEIELKGTSCFKLNEKLVSQFEVFLNSKLFLPALESFPEPTVVLNVTEPERPIVFGNADILFLVMPLSVNPRAAKKK